MRIISILSIILITFAIPFSVLAMGLPELISAAVSNNENLMAAKSRIDGIQAFGSQATTIANPNLSVSNTNIGISQALPNPSVFDAKRIVAGYSLMEAQIGYQVEEANLARSIITSYYSYILARHKIETNKELQASLKSFSIQTNNKFEVGQATILDKLKIDYELALATRDLEASQQELLIAKATLANLARIDEKDIAINEDFITPTLAEVHTLDLADNLDLQLASTTVKKLEAVTKVYNMFPEYTVSANNDLIQNIFSVGVSFPIPLWDRGQNITAEAKYLLRESEFRYKAAQYRVMLDMQTQYQQYALATNQLSLYDKYRIQQRANDAKYTAQTQYQANQITTLDYLDSMRSYRSSYLDYWQNKYNQNIAYANIEILLGHKFWEKGHK